MFASDIDGTLLDYDYSPSEAPTINFPLIRQIRERTDRLALITNQGGLPFGVMGAVRKDGQRYPAPEDFRLRLDYLLDALRQDGLFVESIYVCVHHPKATQAAIYTAQEEVKEFLAEWSGLVACTEAWRKPNPAMLVEAGATVYYGDSDEDEQAAVAAGCEFVRVERFVAQQT